jgi:acylphosphatase
MTQSGRESRRWLVGGRVQGVGFRWFVTRAAEEIGLDGWVRNLADGRVEVQAAGSRSALDELERRLREGPRGGRVDDLESGGPTEEPAWSGFSIRR